MSDGARKVYDIALAEVGYREGSNNSNKYAAPVGVPNNDAWCMTFASWLMLKAGLQDLAPQHCDYTGDARDWFQSRGRLSFFPAVGSQCYMGPNGETHVGFVYAYDETYIYTIEGNTNQTGSPQGDGVYVQKRKRVEPSNSHEPYAYGVPAYAGGTVGADPAHPIAGSVFKAAASVLDGAVTPPPVVDPPPVVPPIVPAGVTATSLLAALAKLPSTVAGGTYATDDGSPSDISIKKTSTGAYWWVADMDIDTDGQDFPESDHNSDRQSDTSFHQSNGLPLNSGTLPFIVIPLPSSRFDYRAAGIKGGDSAIVLYNGKFVYAVFGDEGPTTIIGEASYAAAKALGVQGIPYGGVDSKSVTYIVFPGSTVTPIENLTKVIEKGAANAAALITAAGGVVVTPPPVDPPPVVIPPVEPPVSYVPPPFPNGLVPGGNSPSAKPLQAALKKAGYLSADVAASDTYGPNTRAAVLKFYTAHTPPFFPDDAIGPQGWKVLFTQAYGGTPSGPPVPTPPPTSDGEPAMDMTRTTYGGRTVNQRTKVLLGRAAALYGAAFTLSQGSYNAGGVAASAGTHDGGGVVDVSVSNYNTTQRLAVVKALRQAGFAAWLRTPDEGFAYHIHCNAIGDREMSPSGKSQVVQYFNGTNGLANHAPDSAPASIGRPYPAWAAKYR